MRSRPSRVRPIFVFLLGFSAFYQGGCADSPEAVASLAAVNPAQLSAIFADYQAVASTPAFAAAVKTFGSSSWESMQKVHETTTTFGGTYQLSGPLATGLSTALAKSGAEFQFMQKTFGTVQNYWEAIGLNPNTLVTAADLQRGLTILARTIAERSAGLPETPLSIDETAAVAKLGLVEQGVLLRRRALGLLQGDASTVQVQQHFISVDNSVFTTLSTLPPADSLIFSSMCADSQLDTIQPTSQLTYHYPAGSNLGSQALPWYAAAANESAGKANAAKSGNKTKCQTMVTNHEGDVSVAAGTFTPH